MFGLSAVRGDKTTSRPQPTRGRVMKGKKPFFEYFDPKAFNTSDVRVHAENDIICNCVYIDVVCRH